MLEIIKTSIMPTIWVNFKSLRMNFMQYFMLVFIYPLTYLVISVVSGEGKENISHYLIGMFISMMISLFINMQATLISSSNNISIIEMYTVFQVSHLKVFIGQCILHFIMEMPLLSLVLIIISINGFNVSAFILLWIILSFLFLSTLSIYIGGLIRNPNIAGPIINMLYMIIIMITPLYNNVNQMNAVFKNLYAINPLSHMVSLMYWCISFKTIYNPILSMLIIALFTVILGFLSIKRWNNAKAIEKLNLF